MNNQGIAYEDLDIKGDGMEAFRKFYGANRSSIHRGEEGLEFPIFTDGTVVRQGVGVVIAYLQAETKLDGFIQRSELFHGWIDGLHVSGGNPAQADDFISVLSFLKENGLKMQLDTNGKNALLLEQLFEQGLGDRIAMDIKGPAALYPMLLDEAIDSSEVEKSVSLIAKFPEYEFYTTIAPVIRQAGEIPEISYLTPEEIGETAKLIENATGSKKHPYELRSFDPGTCEDERLKSIEPLTPSEMFKYRTAARRYMVLTEIEKK
jgi:pyruvate formate lyase activating enzyme